MGRTVDSEESNPLLFAIGSTFMRFALSNPVLITMRTAAKAKRSKTNLRRVEH